MKNTTNKMLSFFLKKPSGVKDYTFFPVIRTKQLKHFKSHFTYQKKFITFKNLLMRNGKKLKVDLFLLKLFYFFKFQFKIKFISHVFMFLLENLEPFFELRHIKRYGKKFIVPCSISPSKRCFLGNMFFIKAVCSINNQKRCGLFQAFIIEFTNLLRDPLESLALKNKKIYSNQLFSVKTSAKFIKVFVNKISY